MSSLIRELFSFFDAYCCLHVYSWITPRFLSASANRKLSDGEKSVTYEMYKIPSVNEEQVYIFFHIYIKSTQSELHLLFYSVTWQLLCTVWQGQVESRHGQRNQNTIHAELSRVLSEEGIVAKCLATSLSTAL